MQKFPWGVIIDRHSIGPYEIVEYDQYVTNSKTRSGDLAFHGFIDGQDSNESWLSLDEAMAGLIVRRQLGPNYRQINQHFIAGIKAIAEQE